MLTNTGVTIYNNFNPRSREGSDADLKLKGIHHRNFNPRSREGSDIPKIPNLLSSKFQSTLPRRERLDKIYQKNIVSLFQSTLPRRERRKRNQKKQMVFRNFNPRSREGSDQLRLHSRKRYREFQSTLPRRERLLQDLLAKLESKISIHAPAKGATPVGITEWMWQQISIHAPAKGATGQVY